MILSEFPADVAPAIALPSRGIVRVNAKYSDYDKVFLIFNGITSNNINVIKMVVNNDTIYNSQTII